MTTITRVYERSNLAATSVELSFPLPCGPETKIHIQLTINTTSILLFLTTVYAGEQNATTSLGSFVYALPDVSFLYEHNEWLCTELQQASTSWSNTLYTNIHLRVLCRVYY